MIENFLTELLDSWRLWLAMAVTVGAAVTAATLLHDRMQLWAERLVKAHRYRAGHRANADAITVDRMLRQLRATRQEANNRAWQEALQATQALPTVTNV